MGEITQQLSKKISDELGVLVCGLRSLRSGKCQKENGALSWRGKVSNNNEYSEVGGYETMTYLVRSESLIGSRCSLTTQNRLLIVDRKE